jgi:hypothetical protein
MQEPLATLVPHPAWASHWSPAKGDKKYWKCWLCETARIPINSSGCSAPVILHKHASRCRRQCTWPSASARCWARNEAFERKRKISNSSD